MMNGLGYLFVLIYLLFEFELTVAFNDSACSQCHLTIFDSIITGTTSGFSENESIGGKDHLNGSGKF